MVIWIKAILLLALPSSAQTDLATCQSRIIDAGRARHVSGKLDPKISARAFDLYSTPSLEKMQPTLKTARDRDEGDADRLGRGIAKMKLVHERLKADLSKPQKNAEDETLESDARKVHEQLGVALNAFDHGFPCNRSGEMVTADEWWVARFGFAEYVRRAYVGGGGQRYDGELRPEELLFAELKYAGDTNLRADQLKAGGARADKSRRGDARETVSRLGKMAKDPKFSSNYGYCAFLPGPSSRPMFVSEKAFVELRQKEDVRVLQASEFLAAIENPPFYSADTSVAERKGAVFRTDSKLFQRAVAELYFALPPAVQDIRECKPFGLVPGATAESVRGLMGY